MIQEIIAFGILFIAVAFLIKKFFWKSKKKKIVVMEIAGVLREKALKEQFHSDTLRRFKFLCEVFLNKKLIS
jgi:hypothetical protein